MTNLKDIVMPSERNRGTPTLLSSTAFTAYLFFALLLILAPSYTRRLELASLVEPTSGFSAKSVIELVNQARLASGLPALAENGVLDEAAQAKLQDMFAKQYFAHNAPDNRTPWSFFKEAGYAYTAAGENLAADFLTAEESHQALMNSPTHRANILNNLYTEIGVAVMKGVFQGRESILVAQYFGKPRIASAGTSPAPKPTPAPAPKPAPATSPTTPTTPVAATPAPLPAAAPSPVLGTEAPAPAGRASDLLDALKNAWVTDAFRVETKVVSALALFSLMIAIAFVVMRAGAIGAGVAFRSILLVLLFGYTMIFGGSAAPTIAKVTPSADATVAVYSPAR